MRNNTFLLIPGAWMGEWVWDRLKTELNTLKITVHTLTLSGLEDRKQKKKANLTEHVNNVIDYITKYNLNDIILVGHSYSGFVASIVADKIPHKIASLIFIEAFLPENGKSLLEVAGLDVEEETESITSNNGIWLPPTKDELEYQPSLTTELIDYLSKSLIGHPGKTVTDKATISSENFKNIPTFYIGGNLSETIRNNPNFNHIQYFELNGGHWAMLTKPKELASLMNSII